MEVRVHETSARKMYNIKQEYESNLNQNFAEGKSDRQTSINIGLNCSCVSCV